MGSTFTVKDLTRRYGVTEGTILTWINSGQLRALNVARRPGAKKPRWRVTQEALEAFEALRTATPPQSRTRRRKRADTGIIKFY